MKYVSGMLMALVVIAMAACSGESAPPTPSGVGLPFPEQGQQYRLSEVCESLQGQGYDVRGTLDYTVTAEDLSGLLERLPALARAPVEGYLDDGVRVRLEIRSLCNALNTE